MKYDSVEVNNETCLNVPYRVEKGIDCIGFIDLWIYGFSLYLDGDLCFHRQNQI